MRVFLKLIVMLAALLPIHSCFGPFNPDDPGMGILPGDDTTGTSTKTPATMVAWWKCDDSTKFVNSASYTGISASTSSIQKDVAFDTGIGATGLSLLFNDDTYVNVSDDSLLNFKLNDFTISLWCKLGTQVNEKAVLISKGLSDSASSFTLIVNKELAGVIIGKSTSYHEDTLNAVSWNHIVLSRREGSVSLYVNFKKKAIGTEPPSIFNTYPLRIGADNLSQNFYRGNIDEIKIERKAWTENEIRAEYDRFRK